MNLSQFFQTKTRDNGQVGEPTSFTTLTDAAPAWLHDAVMAAHDGEFPNDWRYGICASIASAIDQGQCTPDDAGEIADSLVDTYNSDLLKWLSNDTSRSAYIAEACEMEKFDMSEDVFGQIRAGQFVCIERMACELIEAWQLADEDDFYSDLDES